MIAGVTGTQGGTGIRELAVLRDLLLELGVTELHHGDCIGVDAQAADLANNLGIRTIAHPCDIEDKRAHWPSDEVWPVQKPLVRNRDIVAVSDVLIALPSGLVERRRGSGTWATIRYGRAAGIPVHIIPPHRVDN